MPFREPPNLDSVDTSFVAKAGTPASEMLRESSPPRAETAPKPSRKTHTSETRRAHAEPEAKVESRTVESKKVTSDAPAELPVEEEGKKKSETKARGSRKARARSGTARPATSESSSASTRGASKSAQFVEPDARMLVNVRMPVALHERLKAASEHTSLTITDIVIRGTETELDAVERRYQEIMGESIPSQRRKVRID